MSTRADTRLAIPVNEETRPLFLGLVFSLMGEVSRIKDMGANQVKPEWLFSAKTPDAAQRAETASVPGTVLPALGAPVWVFCTVRPRAAQ